MTASASKQTFRVQLPDGAVLSGSSTGEGSPVLLLSGLGGSEAFWQDVRQGLPGYRCIAFDQRGIGASTRGSAVVTVAQLAQDCLAVLDALGVGPVHAVGHSTGGCIVQEMALMQPDRLHSLFLGGTWAGPDEYMAALFSLRDEILQRSPECYERLGLLLSYPAQWLREHPEKLAAAAQVSWTPARVAVVRERIAALLAHDRRGQLQAVRSPCLVVGAADDQVVPLHLQRELARLLPAARLEVLETGAHFFPVARRLKYLEILQSWLGGQDS
ncbi:alpha/beta fold hydrolase [Kerstersia gyiorum]|uniref:alpha/beta fold hydrolase n=1 Tax=Kerstersia gyiorum TaxID=206506 RepID=UPI0010713FDF|nr:alpha/beta hydrolase [Kerstersia gyiorum]MCP1634697.1 pimeloyl-ACP methyl ester carboxylesterase [Kerstersia gyiorum]MCP1635926.1 pimeloyl-ACP methyl ester carboxylesterase [Kerstersia gyiorum]MCP1672601.1 pimeloyl-ACP methyl ester carboxylesterase [Kerstersia gyiorum]MCP1680582.1 pimeloyl-ACP methyl ester carboxylesterase [Kerstersia gyiorum]MCP1683893.1 pimeloyl-ACP methyl ester carboxylesterase [Kerstersia gyiorum]